MKNLGVNDKIVFNGLGSLTSVFSELHKLSSV